MNKIKQLVDDIKMYFPDEDISLDCSMLFPPSFPSEKEDTFRLSWYIRIGDILHETFKSFETLERWVRLKLEQEDVQCINDTLEINIDQAIEEAQRILEGEEQ